MVQVISDLVLNRLFFSLEIITGQHFTIGSASLRLSQTYRFRGRSTFGARISLYEKYTALYETPAPHWYIHRYLVSKFDLIQIQEVFFLNIK